MIFGLTDREAEECNRDWKQWTQRPRRRFALFPIQLCGFKHMPDNGRWIWLEWYELRRYGWGGNTRRRWPEGLRNRKRVTTHAGMTRHRVTNLMLGFIILLMLAFFVNQQDQKAIDTVQISKCWTPWCKGAVLRKLEHGEY
jgi:hypothetical protein